MRRVEALVGADAYSVLAREHAIVGQVTEMLKARPEDLPERIGGMLTRLKDAASKETLDAARIRIREEPRKWIAQPTLEFSTIP